MTNVGDTPQRRRWFDREVMLAVLLAALVIVPRSALIGHAHSEGIDDEYHLAHGLAWWMRSLEGQGLNDPPLGAAIMALPMMLTGCRLPSNGHALYGQPMSCEMLLVLIATWKAILFLPMVAAAFVLLRRMYNREAAWLGAALLTFEPTFAAFTAAATLDVLGVEGIFFAVLAAWRYFERPGIGRMIVMIVAMAAAVLLKHTAILLPVVIVIFAGVWNVRALVRREPIHWRRLFGHAALAVPIFAIAIWGLLLFDISRPTPFKYSRVLSPLEQKLYTMRLPAGPYVGSILAARAHVERGHPGYLLGEKSKFGWWYYLPVVATYKVPIPIALLVAATIISIAFVRPRWDEWPIFIAFVAWSIFLMRSGISIGFRHFLPAYLFLLLLIPRCMVATRGAIVWKSIAWICAGATAIHATLWHPNYLSYINCPREKVWLDISDSNLDWGQALRQAAKWIDSHPQYRDRRIYIGFFGGPGGPHVPYHIAERAIELNPHERPPLDGIVILSPMWVAGTYHPRNHYAYLQHFDPIEIIGGSMLVYDLDAIRHWEKHARPKRSTRPATTRAN